MTVSLQGGREAAGFGSSGTAQPSPATWLLADIGGTNARFGWWVESDEITGAAAAASHVVTLAAADFEGPAAAARAYLQQLAQRLGSAYRAPKAAAFAVATAVSSDEVVFTNSRWSFSRRSAQTELDLDRLVLLNDFEALALSLPLLHAQQLRPIVLPSPLANGQKSDSPRLDLAPDAEGLTQPLGAERVNNPAAAPTPAGVKAVVGPGTGLGVAAVVPTPAGWIAVPGEGGHASLAAADALEADLLAAVRRTFPHVSAERLLSGIGLPVLHQGLAQVMGQTVDAPLQASEIVQRGLAGQDALCSRTLDLFCALLGGFAGNVALTLGARGGLYIGGGIVPRLGQRFFDSQFRARFEAKGRFESYLKTIPTLLITDTLAALTGAASALRRR